MHIFKTSTRAEHFEHIVKILSMSGIEPSTDKINKYLDLAEDCGLPREHPAFPLRMAESSMFGKSSQAWKELWEK
ncbi:MAG: hypothetical protein EBU90_06780 [Proteobacteria bacterium]|nr:hypothetical protein [Pseudomonadota bacterium]NBP14048.1 hypothetical protein [bacterium]